MPSYFWRDEAGQDHFGSDALAYPQAVHSIKLALRDGKVPIPRTWHLSPAALAQLMIGEALRRGLQRLQAERVLTSQLNDLRLETNTGCTPLFPLQARLLLRDICRELGLAVKLTNLVEEPTAAAFEVTRLGLSPGGRMMVIDVGGGTLDVCVLEADLGRNRYRIFATGAEPLGGDRYTDIVAERLSQEVLAHAPKRKLESTRDRGLIWQRAEDAKIRLSDQPAVQVALGGIAGLAEGQVELTQSWFSSKAGALVRQSISAVETVYRMARFSLDRGGPLDPRPGGSTVELRDDGHYVSVGQLKLEKDGREHLDTVFLLGGGARLPRLRAELNAVFGDRLIDLELFGQDPVSPVVRGLARHQPLESLQLQYPNWAVNAIVSDRPDPIPLFEPFSPVFDFGWSETLCFPSTCDLGPGSSSRTIALEFRPLTGPGTRWAPTAIGAGKQTIELRIDLFGNLSITANKRDLYPDRPAPWKLAGSPDRPAWLQPEWKPPSPDSDQPFDLVNSGPG